MRRLEEILLERGLLTQTALADVHAGPALRATWLGARLVRAGAVSETALLNVIAEETGLARLEAGMVPDADDVRAAADAVGAPLSWLIANDVIVWRDRAFADARLEALAHTPGAYCVAGPRIFDPWIQESIEHWGLEAPRCFLAAGVALEPILSTFHGVLAGQTEGRPGAQVTDPARLMELAEEAPVIDFVNAVFGEAVASGASDVHFEPFEDRVVVRLRIDGVLIQRRVASRGLFDAISSRIKLLSGMDIAERRLPQDGRQSIRIAGREVDIRVSSLPTTWGESIVVRLLGSTRRIPDLDALGLSQRQREILLETIARPNGLVLVTGPTGSGKTTTVYRLIAHLNDGVRKIVTIEDPVEFELPGVLQMTARADIGLDFAAGLRSILRQDPDVIFVGEIRDSETARTAIQAALTGHLVISTVHTNSALAAVARMIDLGVEPFLLADVLRAVVGQRLVRKICIQCRRPSDDAAMDEERARSMIAQPASWGEPSWSKGVGCSACAGSGFKGRTGVFEATAMNTPLQHAIRTGASEPALHALAQENGFTSLLENGLALARAGETTLEEALRVVDAGAPPARTQRAAASEVLGR